MKQRNLHTNHCLVFGPNRLSGCAIVGLRLRAKLRKESCPILFGQTTSAHNTAASCEIVVSMPCKSHTHTVTNIFTLVQASVFYRGVRVCCGALHRTRIRACVCGHPTIAGPDDTHWDSANKSQLYWGGCGCEISYYVRQITFAA